MSGKTIFRNIMGILLPGVNAIINERTNQIYGQLLEKAVELSLEIIILVFEKDVLLSDFWRPLYQVDIFNFVCQGSSQCLPFCPDPFVETFLYGCMKSINVDNF